jgi:hypothetical protein
MAKQKPSSENKKVVFGVRRNGKHKKTTGPKDKKVKLKYVGQGR